MGRPAAEPDYRCHPDLYRVGRGETGVFHTPPYTTDLLPLWRFRTPAVARESAAALYDRYLAYRAAGDFVGMDIARKFLQMGYTRARRYANRRSGRKYAADGSLLPPEPDAVKAAAAAVFREIWQRVVRDPEYVRRKAEHAGRPRGRPAAGDGVARPIRRRYA